MTDDGKRAPRSFNLDSLEQSGAEPKETAARKKKTASGKPAAKETKSTKTKARKPRAVSSKAVLQTIPDQAAQRAGPSEAVSDLADSLTPPPAKQTKRPFRWSRIFWIGLTGLVSLAFGLWTDQLIRELFARQDWLGWLAVGFFILLLLAGLAIVLRELTSLRRMNKIDHIREDAELARKNDDMAGAIEVTNALTKLYEDRPDTARGRALLAEQKGQIIDGRDLINLAERDLLHPLDLKARALVMGSAKRVSVVTAVSPRAVVDIGYVLVENSRMIRRLAELYGGRPSTLGFWRLARTVIAHLAVTGTIAVGDGILQQLVGQGVASRISSRLGEGVVNGVLTARIGIAAIDVCRPLGFSAETRPSVRDFLGELVKFSGNEKEKE